MKYVDILAEVVEGYKDLNGIMTPAKGDTLKKYTNQTIDKIPGQKARIFWGRQNTDWTKNLTCLQVFCPIDKKYH